MNCCPGFGNTGCLWNPVLSDPIARQSIRVAQNSSAIQTSLLPSAGSDLQSGIALRMQNGGCQPTCLQTVAAKRGDNALDEGAVNKCESCVPFYKTIIEYRLESHTRLFVCSCDIQHMVIGASSRVPHPQTSQLRRARLGHSCSPTKHVLSIIALLQLPAADGQTTMEMSNDVKMCPRSVLVTHPLVT